MPNYFKDVRETLQICCPWKLFHPAHPSWSFWCEPNHQMIICVAFTRSKAWTFKCTVRLSWHCTGTVEVDCTSASKKNCTCTSSNRTWLGLTRLTLTAVHHFTHATCLILLYCVMGLCHCLVLWVSLIFCKYLCVRTKSKLSSFSCKQQCLHQEIIGSAE